MAFNGDFEFQFSYNIISAIHYVIVSLKSSLGTSLRQEKNRLAIMLYNKTAIDIKHQYIQDKQEWK